MKPVFLTVGEILMYRERKKTRSNLAVQNWKYQQKGVFFSFLHWSCVQTVPSSVNSDLLHTMAVPVEISVTVEKG